MRTATNEQFPTEKLRIDFPPGIDPLGDEAGDLAVRAILAKAAELVVAGERPWFEVWYARTTAHDFDAVEVADDGTITTLPPYSAEQRALRDAFLAETEAALP